MHGYITKDDISTLKNELKTSIDSILDRMNKGDMTPALCDQLKRKMEIMQRVETTLVGFREGKDVSLQDHIVPDVNPDVDVLEVIYRDVPGAGKKLFARFVGEQNCVEFNLNPGVHTILETEAVFGYEPWIQFEPEARDKIMDTLLQQLASAWNEKYGNDKLSS